MPTKPSSTPTTSTTHTYHDGPVPMPPPRTHSASARVWRIITTRSHVTTRARPIELRPPPTHRRRTTRQHITAVAHHRHLRPLGASLRRPHRHFLRHHQRLISPITANQGKMSHEDASTATTNRVPIRILTRTRARPGIVVADAGASGATRATPTSRRRRWRRARVATRFHRRHT